MLLFKTTAQERKMFLLRDSVDSVKQIKKTVILATFRMRLRLGLYRDADLHCGTVLEDEFGLSFLRNLITILDNKRSGSVHPKKPHSAIRQNTNPVSRATVLQSPSPSIADHTTVS